MATIYRNLTPSGSAKFTRFMVMICSAFAILTGVVSTVLTVQTVRFKMRSEKYQAWVVRDTLVEGQGEQAGSIEEFPIIQFRDHQGKVHEFKGVQPLGAPGAIATRVGDSTSVEFVEGTPSEDAREASLFGIWGGPIAFAFGCVASGIMAMGASILGRTKLKDSHITSGAPGMRGS